MKVSRIMLIALTLGSLACFQGISAMSEDNLDQTMTPQGKDEIISKNGIIRELKKELQKYKGSPNKIKWYRWASRGMLCSFMLSLVIATSLRISFSNCNQINNQQDLYECVNNCIPSPIVIGGAAGVVYVITLFAELSSIIAEFKN
jgi:hypothetical protein